MEEFVGREKSGGSRDDEGEGLGRSRDGRFRVGVRILKTRKNVFSILLSVILLEEEIR